MPTKLELDSTYMGTAMLHAKLSKAIRKKVGAVAVTQHGVTLTGYNGRHAGADNRCEDTDPETGEMTTRADVLHAEQNVIIKAAKEGISLTDAIIFITLSPCLQCSAMMVQAGIKEVTYAEDYRSLDGVELLKKAGIKVTKFKE